MPLSLNKVYKKPEICGECSFVSKEPPGKDRQWQKPCAHSDENPETEQCFDAAVTYWPGSEIAGDKQHESFSDSFSARDPQEHSEQYPGPAAEGADHYEPDSGSRGKSAEAILEERLEQCLREGYAQGKARAEDECRAMKESASAKMREAELSLREARQRSKEIIASSEKKIVELAVAVAERLVRTQLQVEPETITAIVRETMNMLNGGEQVEIFVNPADHHLCAAYTGQLKEEFKGILKLDILSDQKVPRGSCRIESECGLAEYLIDEEKEQLREALLSLARKEEPGQNEEEDPAYGRH